MKILIFIMFFTLSCSSWKSKDFKRTEDVKAQNVKKEFDLDQKTLNKYFPKEEAPKVERKVVKKIVEKTSKKNSKEIMPKEVVKQKKTVVVPILKSSTISADYPAAYNKLNKETAIYFKSFKKRIFPGEKLFIDISYLGVNAGQIVVETLQDGLVGGVPSHHYYAKLKSAPFYKFIYELDDTIDSYVEKETFLPLKYTLLQRESGQDVDDIQIYDRKKLKTISLYKRVKKKKDRPVKKWNKETYIPAYYSDALSVLHLMRGLPLNLGDRYKLPVVNKAKVLILNTTVLKKEKISTELGKFSAIKINVKSSYSGETIKSGDMTFWFSDDERRILLKIKAKIKIGSVIAETVKYEK